MEHMLYLIVIAVWTVTYTNCQKTESCAAAELCCNRQDNACIPPGSSCYCDNICLGFQDCCSDYTAYCTDCGLQTAPKYGSVSYTSPCPANAETACTEGACTLVGCQMNYTCDSNYRMVGTPWATCQANGFWSAEIPTCTRRGLFAAVSSDELLLTGADDACRDVIFTTPLPIFGREFRKIFVCTDGYLVFNRQFFNPIVPEEGKEDDKLFKRRDWLAVYHTDMDFREGGAVRYKVIDTTVDNDAIASDIDEYIVKHEKIADYRSLIVIKATWLDATQIAKGNTATCQIILSSDGVKTYGYYFYDEDKMHFDITNVFIGYGFRSGDFFRVHNSADGSFLQRPDMNLYSFGWQGSLRLGLTTPGTEVPNYAAMCRTWHSGEIIQRDNDDYLGALSLMPQCPCNDAFFVFDRRFERVLLGGVTTAKYTTTLLPLPWVWVASMSKTCSYDRKFGNFLRGDDVSHFIKWSPVTDRQMHEQEDIYWKDVCCTQSDMCTLFYDVRPIASECYNRLPFDIATMWGDPHIITLDDMRYTFNGLGEYLLISVTNTFGLQCRTEKARTNNGSTTDATIYSAFAVAVDDNMYATLTVQLNGNKTDLIVFVNGADYTKDYQVSHEFSMYTPDVQLTRYNNTLVSYFPAAEISLNISLGIDMLTMSIVMPNTYRGATEGMMGNYNGNKSDDLIARGASESILEPFTDSKIYEMGETWRVTEEESLFKPYPPGYTYTDFNPADFVPIFLDEVNETVVEHAKVICGDDNLPCIYDFVITGSQQVAEDSKAVEENTQQAYLDLQKVIPSVVVVDGTTVVNGKHSMYVDVGTEVTFVVNGTGTGTIHYKFVNNSANATFGTYDIGESVPVTFKLTDTEPAYVSLTAEDDDGATAPAIDINIVLCTGCSGHGQCSPNKTRTDSKTTQHFKYAECECGVYYDGDDCELDLDGCDIALCGLGRTCTDRNATEHMANPELKPYSCSPCPSGYLTIADKCIDVDECVNSTLNLCTHICVNTEGNYTCTCDQGYTTDSNNVYGCIDVNECADGTNDCTQICTNIEGGFTCSCHGGFVYNNSTNECIPGAPTTACLTAGIDCTNSSGCTTSAFGTTTCFCDSGYELRSDNSCANIDECSLGRCSDECTDSDGSYTCSCRSGYFLNSDRRTCSACKFPAYGENCSRTCFCVHGKCNHVIGCECDEGWQGTDCDVDIEECQEANICGGDKEVCENTVGSYICKCKPGYKKDTDTCTDIDECTDVVLNICEQKCSNTQGGFTCGCNNGYIVDFQNPTHCIDYDECKNGGSGCQQLCHNFPGRFNCDCHSGFVLNDDRRTCSNVSDPCDQFSNVNCSHICLAVDNNPECSCNIGYKLADDNQTCIDINECDTALYVDLDPALNPNKCSEPASCSNDMGGYSCSCSLGFEMQNDKRTCKACDKYHYGENCSTECSCGVGAIMCHSVTGCICKDGWTGKNCTEDIDECHNSSSICTESNTECVNNPGSYECACRTGYMNDTTGICTDLDECNATTSMCGHNSNCTNSIGSFTCNCLDGYTGNPPSVMCADINECNTTTSVCGINSNCNNNEGSFNCQCIDGYTGNPPSVPCTDEDECNETPYICGDNSNCTNNVGSFSCQCTDGYTGNPPSVTCEDVDECIAAMSTCGINSNCINIEGSFTCECIDGYTGNPPFVQCADLDECIEIPTICGDKSNCTNNDGSFTCQCTDGYSGTPPSIFCEDLDECNTVPDICGDNSNCTNKEGSFTCQCLAGYTGNPPSTTCEDVDECNTTPSVCGNNSKCINTEGSFACQCMVGYTGNPPSVTCADADECNVSPSICGDHSNCTNSVGSFTCHCLDGYMGNPPSVTCEDVNECTAETSVCGINSNCINIDGGFSCECMYGYTGNPPLVPCSDIDECMDTPTICGNNSTCTNSNGSFTCQCIDGYSGTPPSIFCEDLNECNTTPGICGDNSNCTNKEGSFTCQCLEGYTEDPPSVTCEDVDECNAAPSVCGNNSNCINDKGSFTCQCMKGYTGNPPSVKCEDEDECNVIPSICGDNSNCTNNVGSFTCHCMDGYKGNPPSVTCEDANECASETFVCGTNSNCINIEGSFTCECMGGYTWNPPSDTCADVDECIETLTICGDNSNCINNDGSFTCQCIDGYSGSPPSIWCEDLDECNTTPAICGDNTNCTNEEGSFTCQCLGGYTGNPPSVTCEDVDECNTTPSVCGINSNCINIDGSFTCKCKTGYTGNPPSVMCADADECNVTPSICGSNSNCTNTVGSFSCQCMGGYTGNPPSFTCEDIDECTAATSICDINSNCINIDGGFTCECMDGYTGNPPLVACADVDECTVHPSVCGINANCINIEGSFTCECMDGYTGSPPPVPCADSDECNLTPTICGDNSNCTNNDGGFTCHCVDGYSGTPPSSTCADDDECSATNVCGSNAECTNTPGAFTCQCVTGFLGYPPSVQCSDTYSSRDMTIILDTEIAASVDLADVDIYSKYKYYLENKIQPIYNSELEDGIVSHIIIRSIVRGSLIVEYTALYPDEPHIHAAISRVNVVLANEGEVDVFGAMAKVLSLDVNGRHVSVLSASDTEVCALFTDSIGGCQNNQRCIVVDNLAKCQYIDASDTFGPMFIIALAIPVVLLVALLIAVLATMYRHHYKKSISYRDDVYNSGFSHRLPTRLSTIVRPTRFNPFRYDADCSQTTISDCGSLYSVHSDQFKIPRPDYETHGERL